MRFLIGIFVLLVTFNTYGQVENQACKNRRGDELFVSLEAYKEAFYSNGTRPQVFVEGKVVQLLPEDKKGRPHQKYIINFEGLKVTIVSNLEFGRVPLKIGDLVQVCGEFLKVGKDGMVHWTHFDPHGGHPDGFTIHDKKLYGDEEI